MPHIEQRLFLSPPDVGTLERQALTDALDSGWIAPVGPALDAFEKTICERIGSKHAVAMSTGTAAIHLALRACGVGSGDRVYCSTLTFAGSCNPIIYEGATPVFIDCETTSWNLDPALFAEAIEADAKKGTLPKALVLTHLYGQSAQLDTILKLCQQYGITLIEDAAEALGATFRGKALGSFGLFGIFSFNGNKIITTSGGGMLVTDDQQAAEQIRKWSTQSRDPASHYEHSELGFNYRMSNLLAALGNAQMQSLDEKITNCKAHYEAYSETFSNIPAIEMMPIAGYGKPNHWLTCITLDDSQTVQPKQIMDALEAQNIESRPLWKPMHCQPFYKDAPCIGGSISEDLFKRGLCLPSGTKMSTKQRNRVIEIVLKCF